MKFELTSKEATDIIREHMGLPDHVSISLVQNKPYAKLPANLTVITDTGLTVLNATAKSLQINNNTLGGSTLKLEIYSNGF